MVVGLAADVGVDVGVDVVGVELRRSVRVSARRGMRESVVLAERRIETCWMNPEECLRS